MFCLNIRAHHFSFIFCLCLFFVCLIVLVFPKEVLLLPEKSFLHFLNLVLIEPSPLIEKLHKLLLLLKIMLFLTEPPILLQGPYLSLDQLPIFVEYFKPVFNLIIEILLIIGDNLNKIRI